MPEMGGLGSSEEKLGSWAQTSLKQWELEKGRAPSVGLYV